MRCPLPSDPAVEGIEIGAELGAPILVPSKRRTIMADIAREAANQAGG
jgi:hypothetical protein